MLLLLFVLVIAVVGDVVVVVVVVGVVVGVGVCIVVTAVVIFSPLEQDARHVARMRATWRASCLSSLPTQQHRTIKPYVFGQSICFSVPRKAN